MHPIAVAALIVAAVIVTAWLSLPRSVRRAAGPRVRVLAAASMVLLTVGAFAAVLPGIAA